MRPLISATVLLLCGLSSAWAWTHGHSGGGGTVNAPIGLNTVEVVSGSPERPFLNLFKNGGGWYTGKSGNNDTGEELYLYTNLVDANHYITSFSAPATTFTGSATGDLLHVSSTPSSPVWIGGSVSGGTLSGSALVSSGDLAENIAISGPATPAVVTLTGSNLAVNQPVIFFANGGTLPAPLTEGPTYFVIASGLGANSFSVSATMGGSAINTTGSGSGTPRMLATGAGTGGIGTYTLSTTQSTTSTTITESLKLRSP